MLLDFSGNSYIAVFWYCEFIGMCLEKIGCHGNWVLVSDWLKFRYCGISLEIGIYLDNVNLLECIVKKLVAMVTQQWPVISRNLDIV